MKLEVKACKNKEKYWQMNFMHGKKEEDQTDDVIVIGLLLD